MRMVQAEWWAEFKIFEDRDGSYSWQLQAASGRIIADLATPTKPSTGASRT